jgi:cytochrome c oxidase assembly protein subunit 15
VLHRLACLVATATFLLLIAGALVTSTGSGLSVPDWPLSYGTLFPRMEGGVLYEHGHRMIAGVVLILTTALCVGLRRSEKRPWVRALGLVAWLAVLVQAALGGLTVLLRLPTAVSVGHVALANLFFGLTTCLALVTSPAWRDAAATRHFGGASSLRSLAAAATAAIYAQILLGAVVRHGGAGLAIPDFPLAFGGIYPHVVSPAIVIHYVHRLGAVVVLLVVIGLAAHVARRNGEERALRRPVFLLTGMLSLQLLLGALTIWTQRAVAVTAAHVVVGAAMLATSLVITVNSYRFAPAAAGKRRAPVEAAPVTATR